MTTAASRAISSLRTDDEAQRRLYFKEKQRLQRIKNKSTHETLRRELANLEEQLHALQSRPRAAPAALPWHQVARAFRDFRNASFIENRLLKVRSHKLATLVQDLRAWVVASTLSVPDSLHAACPTWRNVTLLSNPTSRQLGKEWITQHMYHHMDAMFQHHGFPSTSYEAINDIAVAVPGSIVLRQQSFVPLSTPFLLALYRRHICEITVMDLTMSQVDAGHMPPRQTLREETASTYLHYATRRHVYRDRHVDEVVEVLAGEFHERDRAVFVVHHIRDDDALDTGRHSAVRGAQLWYVALGYLEYITTKIWYELRPATEVGGTYVRILVVLSPLRRHEDMVSLEEEAISWGVDVDTSANEAIDVRVARWHREIHRAFERILQAALVRLLGFAQMYGQEDRSVNEEGNE
ncbi:Aste57867_2917 [Aphanomyces stellatus]|uniref:Aste57867_2917 protein n=1 Tax=Aphanomyces stellatus TaxID=120398 RepID=A0A485KDT3_9STRA|nr:hypothetical protein As57867_002909 [Aphanomyces stellatus]VFT80100.1 Aste57867_2917 [Aphanomyces stellatus]